MRKIVVAIATLCITASALGSARNFEEILEQALAQYRDAACVKAKRVHVDKGFETTLFIHHLPGNFYTSLRRSENRRIGDELQDAEQVTLTTLDGTYVLLQKRKLAVRCVFRARPVSPHLPVATSSPPAGSVSVEGKSSYIDGREFFTISKTFSTEAAQHLLSTNTDPYYLLYGISVATGIARHYTIKQLHYLIEAETLNIYEWRLLSAERQAIVDERYDHIQLLSNPEEGMFKIPQSFVVEEAHTSDELAALMIGRHVHGQSHVRSVPSYGIRYWKAKLVGFASLLLVAIAALIATNRLRRNRQEAK